MNATLLAAVAILAILPSLCWAGPMKQPRDTACPRECTCSAIELKKGQIRSQTAFCSNIPKGLPNAVTTLTVTGAIGRVTKKIMAPLNKNLQVLDFSNCKITNIESGSFDMLTNLMTLKLTDNMIQRIDSGTFSKNSNLRKLYLNGNKLTSVDHADLAKLGLLSELYLDHNQLTIIPQKMPHELTKLGMSNNKLGPKIDSTELRQVNKLKELNLCNNPIESLSLKFFEDISQVQELSLGEKIVLPRGCAKQLLHITSLELVGFAGGNTVQLDQENQREIGEMKMLTSLRIENYRIQTLSFLNKLTNLITLNLCNIIVTGTVDLLHIFNSNHFLTTVNLDKSPEISASLLANLRDVSNRPSPYKISLRNTGVKHVKSFSAQNSNFSLDISENPLQCDCSFEWLQSEAMSLEYKLHSIEKTICHDPEEFNGKLLSEALQMMRCPKVTEQDITTLQASFEDNQSEGFGSTQPSVLHESDTTLFSEEDRTPYIGGEDSSTLRPLAGNEDENGDHGGNVDPTTDTTDPIHNTTQEVTPSHPHVSLGLQDARVRQHRILGI